MKCLEAMLAGMEKTNRIEGTWYKPGGIFSKPGACAMGTLLLGSGAQKPEPNLMGEEDSGAWVAAVRERFPVLHTHLPSTSMCPGCGSATNVGTLVVHFNDEHHLSRLTIGNWLDRLERRQDRLLGLTPQTAQKELVVA